MSCALLSAVFWTTFALLIFPALFVVGTIGAAKNPEARLRIGVFVLSVFCLALFVGSAVYTTAAYDEQECGE